ncbi:MAG: hypothetical protein QJR02_13450 [Sinobacteraceae bacterium]|nr:hypothetical protein [Nevskiaceae bacterium]
MAALALTLGATAWAYWIGLQGPFLLDDEANLAALGDHGGIHDRQSFFAYVTSGRAGPLGRPLSLASFVLNAQNWPTDPWGFKFTNLLIHLVNMVLVFWLARRLLSLARAEKAAVGALLCTALWGLHPIQVSTVLYAVQRMTELSAGFTLLGLIAFVHGRTLAFTQAWRGYAWMVCGIGVCGVLAVLSKETGGLLPVYGLCLEYLLLRRATDAPPRWRIGVVVLLWMPVLALVTYLTWHWPQILRSYAMRDFTPAQRLLTEGRVLAAYLHELLLPRLASGGIFGDDFLPSQNLWTPDSTAWSWLLVLALLAAAFALHRRQPILSLGMFWYFCGHLLESTLLPLELYFEHRNYLPAFGLACVGGYYGQRLVGKSAVTAVTAGALVLGFEFWLTQQQARVWGNEALAARIWPLEHQNSLRAHQFAARFWLAQGDAAAAARDLEAFSRQAPLNSTARLQTIELHCLLDLPVEAEARNSLLVLRNGTFDFGGPDSLARIQRYVESGHCADLQPATLMNMIDAYAANPKLVAQSSQVAYLDFIKASALAATGQYAQAAELVGEAGRLQPNLFASYWQARWLFKAGSLSEARRFLALALADYQRRFGPRAPLDGAMTTLVDEIASATAKPLPSSPHRAGSLGAENISPPRP